MRKSVKTPGEKSKWCKKESSRELTKKTKKNVFPLSQFSTAVIICGSMQLPHHEVIQQNGEYNSATLYNNMDTNAEVSEHITAKIFVTRKQ